MTNTSYIQTMQYMKKYISDDFRCFVLTVTRLVACVEQELLTLPKHMSSPPVFRGYCVVFLRNILYIVVCLFVLFPLAIVLPVLLRFTASDYLFGIFKMLLKLLNISAVVSIKCLSGKKNRLSLDVSLTCWFYPLPVL